MVTEEDKTEAGRCQVKLDRFVEDAVGSCWHWSEVSMWRWQCWLHPMASPGWRQGQVSAHASPWALVRCGICNVRLHADSVSVLAFQYAGWKTSW